jgi:phage-related protein
MNTEDKSQDTKSDIPLLEDVVSMDEIESEDIDFSNDEAGLEDSDIPEYDEELLSMRDDIVKQLENDLRPSIAAALNIAIDEATARISQILHDELDNTLNHRINSLIEQQLEKQFGPRPQHTSEESTSDRIDLYHDDNL